MKTKRMILSTLLVIALIANLVMPPVQTTALAESTLTLTIEDKKLYEELKETLNDDNNNALQTSDDEKQELTFNPDNVTTIYMILDHNITSDNFRNTIETLFRECTRSDQLRLKNCDLSKIDCSIINNMENLDTLAFVNCKLDRMPDLTLPKLRSLFLSKNHLSSDSIRDNLNKTQLPSLKNLWLDDCNISNIDFIQNLGNLQILSLANNKLTDDSIQTLAGMANLSDLNTLNLGIRVYIALGGSNAIDNDNPNKNIFTDYAGLSLLPAFFPKLTELDLSGLKITSIQAFTGIKNTPKIIFDYNNITDFTGLTMDNNFVLFEQTINQYFDFIGQEIELPEIMKRILDPGDILYSSRDFTCTGCHLSDDKTKLAIEKNNATVNVTNGKLSGTIFNFKKKQTPSYTIPKNLTGYCGDTLASIVLPDGFSWKDPAQILEKEGSYRYKAVYTPSDTDKYTIVNNINIQVTVKAKPTPTLEPSPTSEPSLTPEPSPTQEPTITPEPSLASEPSLTPDLPTPTPDVPTPTPDVPTPTPEVPTPTPEIPTPTPPIITPTPKPDESKLTGNQIEKRTDLPILLATGKQNGKSGIKLTWNKWSGCSGYEVYWSYCDGKQNFKKLKTVKNNGKRVCVHNKLRKTRAYKYYIATYKIKKGRKNYLSKSSVIHVAMKQEKHTNVKKIKLNKTKLVLKPKKKFNIKATTVLENKKKKALAHEPKIRYYTGNKQVATVTKKGVIKAKKQGTCTIYVIANNGVSNTIKLTVK